MAQLRICAWRTVSNEIQHLESRFLYATFLDGHCDPEHVRCFGEVVEGKSARVLANGYPLRGVQATRIGRFGRGVR